ncbi:craniofacial development protein 2-like [Leptidea sinapis]|uniref:craniofacial development protein 2-like n=1 Tax=Leptidea sinapis TaxID=189913 RepID=UPI0021C25E40|nr:craniofacial development protein 2-like [Leptidea sinapis]
MIKNAANARAFPRSDAKVIAAHQFNQKLRIANLNVGSMTGRSSELSEVLLRRRVNICCIQETRWKGSKSRDIGNGFKLLYNGSITNKNGGGIVIDQDLQERIVEVHRVSDRLMSIKFVLDNQPCMNVVSAYAPQTGCTTSEKEIFWNDLDDLMQSIPTTETKYILGDFNGHIGQTSPFNARVHGGYGYKWWTDDVKQKLEQKKTLFKSWQNSKEETDLEAYRTAKKVAKRAVAQAKVKSAEDFYAKLHNIKEDR